MSGPTHILGGFVFAGTLLSFTDVNILEQPLYIGVCAAWSIFPDIDTTKSFIGKLLYPIAWIIYQKFGHRTVTHSLFFMLFVWIALLLLNKFGIIADSNLIKISLFSLLSHYVFDMITVSGIPLLYPFLKNPCVVPGNPKFRFKTADLRSEVMVSGVCLLLCITMQPLFANGFWTTYNRSFGTIKHVDRENRNTEFYIVCEYSFVLNAETHEGEAIVIDSKLNEITLFNRRQVLFLNADDPQLKINYTRPRVSTIEKRFEEFQFFNITHDSLHTLLSGKLASGIIQSNKNVQYIEGAITYNTNFIKFNNRFDFLITPTIDSSKFQIKTNIARLEASIKLSNQKYQNEYSKFSAYQNNLKDVESKLTNSSLSHYERNKLQQELIRLRNHPIEKPVYQSPEAQISELKVLRNSLTDVPLYFSGHMTVFTFGFDSSEDFAQMPIYNCDYLLAQYSSFPLMYNYAD